MKASAHLCDKIAAPKKKTPFNSLWIPSAIPSKNPCKDNAINKRKGVRLDFGLKATGIGLASA